MHKSIVFCDDISPDYLQEIESFLEEWESDSSTINVSTSGSSGSPKQILLNIEKVRASAKATGEFFHFKAGQSLLLNLSPQYIAGKLMIVRALEHSMRILIAPAAQNPLLTIGKERIDFAAFVPYQVEAILGNEATKSAYEKIPSVIIGGAPVPAKVEHELIQLKNQSYATFGMTETITHFALRNISRSDDYYSCLPGVTVDVDERGCLIINENKITKRLVTNDLITKIDSDKFKWHGRMDNVVNSAGVKLFPETIEKKVADLFMENRFYFCGRKSDVFGEELVLYVEGEEAHDWTQVLLELNARLSVFERPKAIIFVPKFTETRSGKVKRENF